MRSSPEQKEAAGHGSRSCADGCRKWNRKLHYLIGLYFLFFVWLFALTGLLLNHSSWTFAEFWPNRKVSISEHQVHVPVSSGTLEQARELLRQLGIRGEIQWLTTRPNETQLELRATKPGMQFDIKADLTTGRATVQRTEVNAWGIMRTMHTFTGVRMGDPKNDRDWILTTIWALSMDAVAAGLVIMVLSGIVMWRGIPNKRRWGTVALGCGVLVCGWFVVGLRWFYG